MTEEKTDRRRTTLALVAFIAGGVVPIQLVTLSFGYSEYVKGVGLGPRVIATAHDFAGWYIPFVYIPALVALLGIGLYARRRYPDLYRRIVVGLGAGVLATIALDAVRQAGVINGWLPSDTVVMFGKMATGSAKFTFFYPAGLAVHYLNGANFGLFFAFVWGKQPSFRRAALWALTWAMIIELGMMTGPPIAPLLGAFGRNYAWPQFFLLTLVAHVAFGLALGLFVQQFLREEDRGWLIPFLLGRRPSTSGGAPVPATPSVT